MSVSWNMKESICYFRVAISHDFAEYRRRRQPYHDSKTETQATVCVRGSYIYHYNNVVTGKNG